ncbi:uncharacterized protein LOC111331089 isoform X1 [Stylophora pistillata]|uniref:Uncharacterized protein n=2 Tax=Stylophora pistillata TaxID=50429 RepID=A0A2B4S7V6_STYPI|nr:uncharacterized protein LOC111331089 isoform X1 [Stylophora pistillata]PFX24890.1 hypothetical protein AWC38_SpisGene10509 [Stylophora pistillata]
MQKNSGCGAVQVTYRSKVDFNVTQTLIRSRSDCFLESKRARERMLKEKELKNRTPWDIKPPDFTLQIYRPKPPKRNTRESMIPGYNEDEWNERAKERTKQRIEFKPSVLPKILQPPVSHKVPFSTHFRIPDSHTAKIKYVREGVHERDPYVTPGPHAFRGDDFRPLENPKKYGLPEFETTYDHDPGNLKFKSRTLNVLYDPYIDQFINFKDGYRRQMITYKEEEPEWDKALILHKGPYNKGRTPGSALMRQIAKQLPWCSPQDKIEQFARPDIFDDKTIDWLEVTAHSKELNRI